MVIINEIIQKIKDAKNTFDVAVERPIPTIKLSILTEKAYKSIPINDILYSLSSFEVIIWTINIKKIIPRRKLGFIIKNLLIMLPNFVPKRGIIKWNIPTTVGKTIISFLFILKVPRPKEKEKVSKEREAIIDLFAQGKIDYETACFAIRRSFK